MSPPEQELVENVRRIVADHYKSQSSPLLLSDLGSRLDKQDLRPKQADGTTRGLRELIEAAHDPDLFIVRDRNSPAYVAVTTAAAKPVVEKYIERRSQTTTAIPDLQALPRSVLLAFCAPAHSGERVFLHKSFPFKYEICSGEGIDPAQAVEVEDRYRRPGLKILNLPDLTAADRLDIQTRIATWSRDKNVPIESFYRVASTNKQANALERLLAAQPPGLASKIVIPADIALLLSRQE